MPYVCPICAIDPESHSLKFLFEKENVLYYYTHPAKAKLYFDQDGIINHYNGVLSEIPKDKEWIWIFNGKDFGLTHIAEIQLAKNLAKLLLTKFSDNLKNIFIINTNFYVSAIYNIIIPFINKKFNSKVEFIEEQMILNSEDLNIL